MMRCAVAGREKQTMLFLAVLVAGLQAGSICRGTEYGDVSVDTRVRFETAEIDGLEDADNLSIRLRLGYTTPEYHGFQGMIEGEFTGVADENSYNAAGVHGDRDKAVIADPKNSQLDQGFLSYVYGGTTVKVGRQLITLDNHRFIGHVGWRQNRQTYDAASIENTSIENLSLSYAYVDRVVRIFGSDAPESGSNAEEADSESHLIHVSYEPCEAATITAYAYLLDLEDIPAGLSSDSYGIIAKGSAPLGDDARVGFRAEVAVQEDAGDNPIDYDAEYYHLQVDGSFKGLLADAGYELLGADRTSAVDEDGAPVFASFKTPLATLHKFNGFADRFLVTPDKGLEDVYVMLGYKFSIPKLGGLTAKVWYHDFSSDEGSDDLGEEWDAVLVKPFELETVPGAFKAVAKYAAYSAGDVGADTDRFTLELNYGVVF